ncbi:hypothetical protein SEPCBS57363_003382 [Sporothrix epigloea]|uniref:Uncharacterized protein n=1 Tax=Sporothrix epigloea TaxID=1892477 RepID=A0ABP0DN44_9PEZI
MSITDEDLQFMADDMWKDALLPDMPGMYGFSVENNAGAPVPVDRLLDAPEVNNDGYQSSKAGEKTRLSKGTLADKSVRSVKNKGKEVSMLSPSTDLYLSTTALVRPTKKSKLSKSLKGASQNESQQERGSRLPKPHKPNPIFPELETISNDPYGPPVPPMQTAAVLDQKKTASPVIPATASSPVGSMGGVIPASIKRPAKPQKRIAKRSYLDPPSSPAQGAEVKLATIPLPKTMPREAAAKPAKQPARPATRKLAKPREAKPAMARRPAVKKEKADMPEPGAAVINTGKMLQIYTPVVEKKPMEEPEDQWTASAASTDFVPDENVIKRLRPRGERAPIMISSDPASSYEEDDESVSSSTINTGTTSMTTPFASMEASVYDNKPTKAFAVAIHEPKYPSKNDGSITTQTEMPDGTEEGDARGGDVPCGNLRPHAKRYAANSRKRSRSPSAGSFRLKQQKSEPVHLDRVKVPAQSSSTNDPFVQVGDAHVPQQQTQFTAKLLQSTAPATAPSGQHTGLEESFNQPPGLQRGNLYEKTRSRQVSSHAPPLQAGSSQLPDHAVRKSRSCDSDDIARQMMQLLTNGVNDSTVCQGTQSPHSMWLDSTDPYRETGQIMTYVCRTILRFLKSKENAIEDVADEYRQRGGAVLSRLNTLHRSERCALIHGYEQRRQRSLDVFETARTNVQLLAGKLEHVNLVPVIRDVLADDVGSRMRVLQTQMV